MNYYATTLSCKYFHITANEHMGRFGASCTYFHNHTSCRQNIMQEKWGNTIQIAIVFDWIWAGLAVLLAARSKNRPQDLKKERSMALLLTIILKTIDI